MTRALAVALGFGLASIAHAQPSDPEPVEAERGPAPLDAEVEPDARLPADSWGAVARVPDEPNEAEPEPAETEAEPEPAAAEAEPEPAAAEEPLPELERLPTADAATEEVEW